MRRTIIGLILVFAMFAGLGVIGWYYTSERIRAQKNYYLDADYVSVSPPPVWIPDRFVEDVLKSSELRQTGVLLDKDIPRKLMEAFAANPWVEKVEQVVPRHPSGADVKLVYRTPVALVDIPPHGTYPIDANGILLPSEYLTNAVQNRRNEHLVVTGIQTTPLGSAGTPWGDPLVQASAGLAAILADAVKPLKITQITPTMETTLSGSEIVCRLKTQGGTEILWGIFAADDPKNDAKKKRLWDLNEQFRTLDNVPGRFKPIDLGRE